jgi:hypothetical protein
MIGRRVGCPGSDVRLQSASRGQQWRRYQHKQGARNAAGPLLIHLHIDRDICPDEPRTTPPAWLCRKHSDASAHRNRMRCACREHACANRNPANSRQGETNWLAPLARSAEWWYVQAPPRVTREGLAAVTGDRSEIGRKAARDRWDALDDAGRRDATVQARAAREANLRHQARERWHELRHSGTREPQEQELDAIVAEIKSEQMRQLAERSAAVRRANRDMRASVAAGEMDCA